MQAGDFCGLVDCARTGNCGSQRGMAQHCRFGFMVFVVIISYSYLVSNAVLRTIRSNFILNRVVVIALGFLISTSSVSVLSYTSKSTYP